MVKKFADQHVIVFSIVIAVIALILLSGSVLLFTAVFTSGIASSGYGLSVMLVQIFARVFPILFTIAVLFTLKLPHVMKLSSKGLLKGVMFGWLFIPIGFALFIVEFDFSKIGLIGRDDWLLLLPIALMMFLVSIFEEFLCRGIIYNAMVNKWGAIKKAAFISSAIFGGMHLINLLFGVTIDAVITQCISTTAFGFLFAAVYARCNNIWAVVLLHTFLNFAASSAGLLTKSDTVFHLNGISTIISLVSSIMAMCIGLFLLRKEIPGSRVY